MYMCMCILHIYIYMYIILLNNNPPNKTNNKLWGDFC